MPPPPDSVNVRAFSPEPGQGWCEHAWNTTWRCCSRRPSGVHAEPAYSGGGSLTWCFISVVPLMALAHDHDIPRDSFTLEAAQTCLHFGRLSAGSERSEGSGEESPCVQPARPQVLHPDGSGFRITICAKPLVAAGGFATPWGVRGYPPPPLNAWCLGHSPASPLPGRAYASMGPGCLRTRGYETAGSRRRRYVPG